MVGVPAGIRVAGELDHRRAGAPAEAVRLDVALNRLRAPAEAAAAGRPPSRRMVAVCDGEVDRTLRPPGTDDVPQLRVLAPHAER